MFMSKSLNLIGCRGDMNVKFSIFLKKIVFSETIRENEAETWHTCLGHSPLHKLSFFFYSGRIRTLVAMAAYIFHRLIMKKVKIAFFCLNGDIWNLFLQKCLLSGPLRFIWLLSK